MEILCSSPWIPAEWIKAHGLDPRGVWSAAPGSAGAAPAGVCAFAHQIAEVSMARPEAAVIFTTACDQMRRAGDAAGGRQARIFLFNLPATWQTATARRLYHSEVMRLGRFLVQLGGCAPSADTLETVRADWDRRRQRLREMLPQANARQAAEMLVAFFDEGRAPVAVSSAPSPGVPLALVGGPVLRSQLGLFDAVESCGGRVVLNAAEPGERCLLPSLPERVAGQTPLAALADHYFDHCVDVFHRPNSRLYSWLRTRLVERRVRGIVLWVRVGCDLWRAEATSLREAFDLPLLILDEHETRDLGPRHLTRLCAFVESLR